MIYRGHNYEISFGNAMDFRSIQYVLYKKITNRMTIQYVHWRRSTKLCLGNFQNLFVGALPLFLLLFFFLLLLLLICELWVAPPFPLRSTLWDIMVYLHCVIWNIILKPLHTDCTLTGVFTCCLIRPLLSTMLVCTNKLTLFLLHLLGRDDVHLLH